MTASFINLNSRNSPNSSQDSCWNNGLTLHSNEQFKELTDYQRRELWQWSALELFDLGVIEAKVKPNSLSNEIHPILDVS